MMDNGNESVIVRAGTLDDVHHLATIQRIMTELARSYDLAIREISWMLDKLSHGTAVLAIDADTNEAVGFGCFTVWEEKGKIWMSHSALLVDPHVQANGIGRRISEQLISLSQLKHPEGWIMLLTTNPNVKKIYAKFGGVEVPLRDVIQVCAFWDGCRGCRSFGLFNDSDVVQSDSRKTPIGFCCCDAMIIAPVNS